MFVLIRRQCLQFNCRLLNGGTEGFLVFPRLRRGLLLLELFERDAKLFGFCFQRSLLCICTNGLRGLGIVREENLEMPLNRVPFLQR